MSCVSKIITVEEHFMSEAVNSEYAKLLEKTQLTQAQKAKCEFIQKFMEKGEITEIGERRVEFMEQHGIDVQILSYGNNSPAYLEPEDAIPLCQMANDELAQYCKKYSGKFYGFAVLPVGDIDAAVTELERAVNKLGLKGIIFYGAYHGIYFDDPKFFPIFEKAQELGVPIMLHPGEVSTQIAETYYQGSWSMATANVFAGHGIGWHYDAGVQYMRMILSGIFDRLPELQLICGHWGELLPYYFNRMDDMFQTALTGLLHKISYYFQNNMYLTPSGMFYEDDLQFCLKKVGAGRILWATDYPYCKPENSKQYLEDLDIAQEKKQKIAYMNAEELFSL